MANDIDFTFEVSDVVGRFKVESFCVKEALSTCFEISLTVLSESEGIAFDTLGRKNGVLSLFGQGTARARQFHGSISELLYLGTGRRYSRYQITLVPQLWFLTQRQDCRIFQNKTAPDILRHVFDEAGMHDYRFELTAHYQNKDYVLQYRESDHHFVERLLAEHGLWFYFEHSDSAHTMVIVDSNDAIPELISTHQNASYLGPVQFHAHGGGVADREHIFELEQVHRTLTSEVSYSDYHYLTPTVPLHTTAQNGANTDLQRFDSHGRYTSHDTGIQRSKEWMAEYVVASQQTYASSNIMRLASGVGFEISEHPRSAINRDYLILSVVHLGENPRVHEEESSEAPTQYRNQFVCLPRDVTFRAPKIAPPVIEGPQTAVVVGPEEEEIHTDKLGRIKVQFHWDRYGQSDEHSSCWLRVSQSMAAPHWGAVFLPRIGHEVVVTFLEGDPDRPLVTGAVYNGLHTPPYELPKHKTRTVFRTQSHKADGYNEMYFEDENDQQEVHLRAQKDMKTTVLNNRYRDIGNDEELKVGRNQENNIFGDRKEQIDGHKTSVTKQTFTEEVIEDVAAFYHASLSKKVANNHRIKTQYDQKTLIGKNDQLLVDGDLSQEIWQSRSIDVGGDDNQNIGQHLTVRVGSNTSIKSDGQTAVISSDEIRLQVGAAGLLLKNDGNIHLYGTSVTVDGASDISVKGAKVNMNPSSAKKNSVDSPSLVRKSRPAPERFLEFFYQSSELVPIPNVPYRAVFSDGSRLTGTLDSDGYARLNKPTDGYVEVYYEPEETYQDLAREPISNLLNNIDKL
ncbi:type VI secretion system Vgr family protein [Vibrio neptunius]|uniref:type VI secretion system Vgr family protein n=1 Tax=Vibrio neptunius TaxID=170651 RepID=UPI0019D10F63|nr:type VI secretion system tip protein TssI/VgrG [Vibrio neptunius]MBN3572410.1 type VI secretion system tip protein VgrG [Vibrio neptunius]